MTDTIKTYAIDLGRTVYPVTVPYVERDHIHVYMGTDPEVQVSYTWVTDTSVQLQVAATEVLTVRRVTVPEALDFKNNAWMQESVLDRAFNLTGYQAEEAKDVADLLDPQSVAQDVAALSTDIAVQAAALAVQDALAPAEQARDDAIAQVTLAEDQVALCAAEVVKANDHVASAQQAKQGAETALNGISNELALAQAETGKCIAETALCKAEVVLCKAETTLCKAETVLCKAETALCISARDAANGHTASANDHRTNSFTYQEQAGTYASNAAASASAALANKNAAAVSAVSANDAISTVSDKAPTPVVENTGAFSLGGWREIDATVVNSGGYSLPDQTGAKFAYFLVGRNTSNLAVHMPTPAGVGDSGALVYGNYSGTDVHVTGFMWRVN